MRREMKDSRIEWIGYIPKDWSIRKLTSFSDINIGLTHTPNYVDEGIPFLSVKDISGNKIDFSNIKYVTKEEYENMPIGAKPKLGDILFGRVCTLGVPKIIDFQSDVCIFVSLGYLRLTNEYIAKREYIVYWMNSELFNAELQRFINGSTQQNLNTRWMRNFNVLLPPYIQQNKIANYLDKKVSQIDDIISKQKSLIEKYKAYKQSLITEIVTKGLDKNVTMKDSGIEWIGDIPSNWEIKSIKYLCSCNDESLTNSEDENKIINYVDISSVTFEGGIVNYEELLFKNAPSRARRITQCGDIIVSTVRTYLKAIAIIPNNNKYIVSTGFAVIRARNILNRYLDYFVKSEYFVNVVSLYSKGISYPAIDSFDLMNIKILEPSSEEQKEIADFLDRKCTAIDSVISKKEQLIKKLEIYKKSLIYECVTGKKEVN